MANPPTDMGQDAHSLDGGFGDAFDGSFDTKVPDARPPRLCGQPDPQSCEAAGCGWSRTVGCRDVAACADLTEARCTGRNRDCLWNGVQCAVNEDTRCELLVEADCRAEAHLWNRGQCVDIGPDVDCSRLSGRDGVLCERARACEQLVTWLRRQRESGAAVCA